MLTALLWALIYIAIVCTVGYVALWFIRKIPALPSFVPVVVQVVIAIVCLIILINVFLGDSPHLSLK